MKIWYVRHIWLTVSSSVLLCCITDCVKIFRIPDPALAETFVYASLQRELHGERHCVYCQVCEHERVMCAYLCNHRGSGQRRTPLSWRLKSHGAEIRTLTSMWLWLIKWISLLYFMHIPPLWDEKGMAILSCWLVTSIQPYIFYDPPLSHYSFICFSDQFSWQIMFLLPTCWTGSCSWQCTRDFTVSSYCGQIYDGGQQKNKGCLLVVHPVSSTILMRFFF